MLHRDLRMIYYLQPRSLLRPTLPTLPSLIGSQAEAEATILGSRAVRGRDSERQRETGADCAQYLRTWLVLIVLIACPAQAQSEAAAEAEAKLNADLARVANESEAEQQIAGQQETIRQKKVAEDKKAAAEAEEAAAAADRGDQEEEAAAAAAEEAAGLMAQVL